MLSDQGNNKFAVRQLPEADDFYKAFTRIFILLFFLTVAAVFLLDHLLSARLLEEHREYWMSLRDLLIHFLPLLFLAIFINPIVKNVEKIRDDTQLERIRKSVSAALTPDLNYLQHEIHSLADKRVPASVRKVISSYKDVHWADLLMDAKEIDFAVMYCSGSWLGDNMTAFSDFLKKEGTIRLYLPAFNKIESKFYDTMSVRKEISGKILDTFMHFQEAHRTANAGGFQAFALTNGIRHVVARIRYADGKTHLLISPFRNSQEDKESKPPAILVDESIADDSLRAFIEEEQQFFESAHPFPPIEPSRYLTWEEARNRVFVSSALSCDMGCDFCYSDRILPGATHTEFHGFGKLLAYSVVRDGRFKAGGSRTKILLGAFSEPFAKESIEVSLEFLNTVTGLCENFVHVATRSPYLQEVFSKLAHPKRIVINLSISSLDFEVGGRRAVETRIEQARALIESGAKMAIYVRPVVPGRTLKDAAAIADLVIAAGFKHATVGGLYVDQSIISSLESQGVPAKALVTKDKGFILDTTGTLKKVHDVEVDDVVKIMRGKKLRVFSSSTELLDHFVQGCGPKCVSQIE